MFGFLTPRCPLDDPREKAWTEVGMRWLAAEFGIDRMRSVDVLLPTPENFPDPYHGTPEDVEALMHRLGRHLQLDTARLSLRVLPDEEMPEAAGSYQMTDDGGAIIRIAQQQLSNVEDLLATLSHELSHQLLLGENRLSEEDHDHEMMTDLLPVFLGLGLFGANSTVREKMETSGGWHYWSIRRQGYLPSRIYGYALALFAWVRGEQRPAWADALRLDARHVFVKSLKYLHKTEDSVFSPATTGYSDDERSVADSQNDLDSPFVGRRIVALWELSERATEARAAEEAVLVATSDPETSVRAAAVETLTSIGAEPSLAIPRLIDALKDPKNQVRSAAALALKRYPQHGREIIPPLTDALIDTCESVVLDAAFALSEFGNEAKPAAEYLVKPLRTALIHCKYDVIDDLLGALLKVHPDPDAVLAQHFADDDPEFLRRSTESLTELRADR